MRSIFLARFVIIELRLGPRPHSQKIAKQFDAGSERTRDSCARPWHLIRGELEQIQFVLWHISV